MVIILAESHMLISTYPEYDYAVFEIFLCTESMGPELALETLRSYIPYKECRITEIRHAIPEGRP